MRNESAPSATLSGVGAAADESKALLWRLHKRLTQIKLAGGGPWEYAAFEARLDVGMVLGALILSAAR